MDSESEKGIQVGRIHAGWHAHKAVLSVQAADLGQHCLPSGKIEFSRIRADRSF